MGIYENWWKFVEIDIENGKYKSKLIKIYAGNW